MKNYWIAVVGAGLLVVSAAAQTGASGSAGANTSVSAGQSGADVSASQNTQANAGSEKNNAKHQGGNASASANSSTNANASSGGAGVGNATTLQAELTKSLDAKKAKPGDEVTARVTQDVKSDGRVVIHRGSKLIGHVTEAQARTKENSESKLGIVFDKAVVKGGSEVTLNAIVQALAPGERAPAPNLGDDSGRMAAPAPMGGGAPMGGMGEVTGAATSTVNSTLGGVNNTVGQAAGSTTGTVGAAASGTLNNTSRGVIGMEGLTLSSAASGAANAQGSVISSTSRNVKLESGTRMVLQANGSIQQ